MVNIIESNITNSWNQTILTATRFRQSNVLFAALELDVFGSIDENGTSIKDIIKKIGLSYTSAEQLINALSAYGYLTKIEDLYYPTSVEQLKFLKKKNPKSFREDLLLQKKENEVWMDITKILRGELLVPKEYSRELLDNRILNYKGILNSNRMAALQCVKAIFGVVKKQHKILDIGGGDGVYSSVLLAANPEVDVTVLDLPNCFDGCKKQLKNHIKEGRLHLLDGDALKLNIKDDFDMVAMNELLEIFSKEEKLNILKQARKISPKIAITKFSLSEDGIQPGGAAMFSFRMFLKYPNSYLSDNVEICNLLEEAGYDNIRIHDVSLVNKAVITAGFADADFFQETNSNDLENEIEIDYNMLSAWKLYLQEASSFRLSAIFQAGLELSIFESITPYSGTDLETLSKDMNIHPLPLQLLLNVFIAMKLVEKKEDCYFFQETLLPFLSSTSENSFREELEIYKQENYSWLQMTGKLKGKISKTLSFEADMINTNSVKSYIRSIELANKNFIEIYLKYISTHLDQASSVLDIGGGHGYHAKRICDEYPNIKVNILDLPSVLEVTKKNQADYIQKNRLNIISGNAIQFKLKEKFDVILINDLLHYFSSHEVIQILINAKQVLNKNGVIIITDFNLDFHKNIRNHIFSLKAHLKSANGHVHLRTNLMTFIQKVGLSVKKIGEIENKLFLISSNVD